MTDRGFCFAQYLIFRWSFPGVIAVRQTVNVPLGTRSVPRILSAAKCAQEPPVNSKTVPPYETVIFPLLK